ncbi:MAG: hypothetical protein CMJ16_08900 [Peredibacter sp.]|nr:hypothetical protein [Peredibacter sp.]
MKFLCRAVIKTDNLEIVKANLGQSQNAMPVLLDFQIFKETGEFLEKGKLENVTDISSTTRYSSPVESFDDSSTMLFENLKWMTTNEAAAYLRKSTNAIRTAVCRGHIKARKFRRRLYFKRSELDRLIETSSTIGG